MAGELQLVHLLHASQHDLTDDHSEASVSAGARTSDAKTQTKQRRKRRLMMLSIDMYVQMNCGSASRRRLFIPDKTIVHIER